MKQYSTSLFIFRRDLRVHDNTALIEAVRLSEQVIPCFIFDPKQITPHPYQSQPGLQFMLQSIQDLEQQLAVLESNLMIYQDAPEQIIIRIHKQYNIQAVFVNRDYTPFSRRRDHELYEVCQNLAISFHYLADALLTEPEETLKKDQTAYKVFTAFYNQAKNIPVSIPTPLIEARFLNITSEITIEKMDFSSVPETNLIEGGRRAAISILDNLTCYVDYSQDRDYPALNATSRLSAHLKFGTCSVREVFYAIQNQLGAQHPLIRQLYWRDFFTHIAFHYPHVFGNSFLKKFNSLTWDNNVDYFQAWCTGKTGFPIVDAGIRELNTTGFMHNRVRMVVASFLVKDLHISWRWGERYFAQHLVDYDPCVNNGNWQWAASTGCDAQPYFRIFNPWTQQQKFDKDCYYIYNWLPELKTFPPNVIHHWYKHHQGERYPAPIIDHAKESYISKSRFKEASMNSEH